MAVTNYYSIGGRLLGEETAGVRTDYLTDALGSVTATVDQTGSVLNTYRYKPSGALLAKTGTAPDPAFGWVGSQGYRQASKKYSGVYVRARHYSSEQGRWTTVDPIRDGLNFYAYVRNNPTSIYDPSGLSCQLSQDAQCNQPNRHPIDPKLVDMGNFTCPNGHDLRRIACYCKFDRDGVPCTNDPAWGDINPTQAMTYCYKDCHGFCNGCTLVDDRYAKMPSIYQHCIALHEKRRRVACQETRSNDVDTDKDRRLILECVWEALRRCGYADSPIVQGCRPR